MEDYMKDWPDTLVIKRVDGRVTRTEVPDGFTAKARQRSRTASFGNTRAHSGSVDLDDAPGLILDTPDELGYFLGTGGFYDDDNGAGAGVGAGAAAAGGGGAGAGDGLGDGGGADDFIDLMSGTRRAPQSPRTGLGSPTHCLDLGVFYVVDRRSGR